MTEIQNLQAMGVQRMTSLEIAQVTGKMHKDVLKAIRNMEPAWEKTTERKFALSEYKDSTGRTLPCYSLNKMECLYIATKFNDEARAKLVIRWQQLEQDQVGDPLAAVGTGTADAPRHPTSAGDGSGRDARGRAHRGPRAHQRQQTRRRLHHHHGHRQSGRNGDKGTELVPEGSGCSEMEPGSVQADRELRRARSGSGQALRLLREGRENEKEHLSRLDYKGC